MRVTDSPPPVERRFYIGIGLFMVLLIAAAFGPSLAGQSNRNSPATALVIAHGIVLLAWTLLYLTQAAFVATGRTAVHRRLGALGFVLATAVIVLGYFAVVGFARRHYDLGGDIIRAISRTGSPLRDPTAMLFPLSELLIFGSLVAAALWYRHRPEIHKRLMLLALLSLATEPILHLVGHLTIYWPALRGSGGRIAALLTILLLTVSAIYDRVVNGRVHAVSLWTPIVAFVWQNVLVFVVLPSALWREIAGRLIR
jgi:hypothetical protein